MDKIGEYSTAVKILMLLNVSKRSKKNELVYFIALSDFYYNGGMTNTNIKNINGITYYTKTVEQAIVLLYSMNLIHVNSNEITQSLLGELFVEDIKSNDINKSCFEKISYIYENYKDTDLISEYEKKVSTFIKARI